jgi:uncharacterized membrane protein (DUF106 family)
MFEEITGAVVAGVDVFFQPLSSLSPVMSLFIVSSFVTILVIVLNRLLSNNKAIKEVRAKMNEVREQMTAAQKAGDKAGVDRLLEEMMKMNNEFMKHSYKTMIISLVVISIFLPWMKAKYEGATIAALPFDVPFVGSSMSWLFWYILVSFTIGWVVRKTFGFEQ